MRLRVQLHEGADQVGQHVVADGGTGRYFKNPGDPVLLLGEDGFDVGDLVEDLLGQRQQVTAAVVEQQAAAMPVEQRAAQLVLQFAEGHAHRRLGEVQLLARPGDLLGFGHGNENFQLSEGDGHNTLISMDLNGRMIEIEKHR